MIFFLILIIGTACFGHHFTVLQICQIGQIPVYSTDFILIAMLLMAWRRFDLLPIKLISPFMIFGFFYLIVGTAQDEIALRGAVLSFYALLVPLTFYFIKSTKVISSFVILVNILSFLNHQYYKPFDFSLMYCLASAFLIDFAMEEKKYTLGWVAGLLALNFNTIIHLGVRTGFLTGGIVVLFYLIIYRLKWRKILALYGLVCFFIIMINANQYPPKRIINSNMSQTAIAQQTKSDTIKKDDANWRWKIWMETLSESFKSPIFGHGFVKQMNYKTIITLPVTGKFLNSGLTPPHNEFLTVFYRMGLLGLALFLGLNCGVMIQLFKIKAYGISGALLAWHTYAQLFDVIDSPTTNIFLWILIGLAYVKIKEAKTN